MPNTKNAVEIMAGQVWERWDGDDPTRWRIEIVGLGLTTYATLARAWFGDHVAWVIDRERREATGDVCRVLARPGWRCLA